MLTTTAATMEVCSVRSLSACPKERLKKNGIKSAFLLLVKEQQLGDNQRLTFVMTATTRK